MRFKYTSHFKRNYKSLTKEKKKKFKKQLNYLLANFSHPSLDVKKYDEEKGIWQARVDRNYRFYFLIKQNTIILLKVGPHP